MTNQISRNDTATLLKKDLSNRLAKGYLEEVLMSLKEIYEFESQEASDLKEVIALNARYAQNIKASFLGRITYEQQQIVDNNLIPGALHYIDGITNESAIAFYMNDSIFKRIVLLCREEYRLSELNALFANRFYKRVDKSIIAWKHEEIRTDVTIDLIVFDNFTKEHLSNTPKELFQILAYPPFKETPVLIYSPKRLNQLEQRKEYFERIYFANSPFSIHSRIQEMLLFLKHQHAFKGNDRQG